MKRVLATIALVFLLLPLAACGGDDESVLLLKPLEPSAVDIPLGGWVEVKVLLSTVVKTDTAVDITNANDFSQYLSFDMTEVPFTAYDDPPRKFVKITGEELTGAQTLTLKFVLRENGSNRELRVKVVP